MLELHKGDVVEWLRDSDMYGEFFKNEDVIYLDERYYDESDEILNFEDFVKLYEIVGYWGASVPRSMYEYYWRNRHSVMKYLYDRYDDAFSKILIDELTGLRFNIIIESDDLYDYMANIDIFFDGGCIYKVGINFRIYKSPYDNTFRKVIYKYSNSSATFNKYKQLIICFTRHYNGLLDIINSIKHDTNSKELIVDEQAEYEKIFYIKDSKLFYVKKYNKTYYENEIIFSLDVAPKLLYPFVTLLKHYTLSLEDELIRLKNILKKSTIIISHQDMLREISTFNSLYPRIHNIYNFNTFFNDILQIIPN